MCAAGARKGSCHAGFVMIGDGGGGQVGALLLSAAASMKSRFVRDGGSFSKVDPGRTRTCNLWFRRPTPYPLGHRAT